MTKEEADQWFGGSSEENRYEDQTVSLQAIEFEPIEVSGPQY
jgi:hypothetical protein